MIVIIGGSWVVISRFISPLMWVLSIVTPKQTLDPPPRVEPVIAFLEVHGWL